MIEADEQPTEDLIKAGVRSSVALQQRNPTAISDGEYISAFRGLEMEILSIASKL